MGTSVLGKAGTCFPEYRLILLDASQSNCIVFLHGSPHRRLHKQMTHTATHVNIHIIHTHTDTVHVYMYTQKCMYTYTNIHVHILTNLSTCTYHNILYWLLHTETNTYIQSIKHIAHFIQTHTPVIPVWHDLIWFSHFQPKIILDVDGVWPGRIKTTGVLFYWQDIGCFK